MEDNGENIQIHPIQIMMILNGAKTPVPFTYSMIASNPDLANLKIKGDDYSYPYFTNSVQYPVSTLKQKGYEYACRFFFDKTVFAEVLENSRLNYVDTSVFYKQLEPDMEDGAIIDAMTALDRNTVANISCMLSVLLPIHTSFDTLLESSYHHYILENFNDNVFYSVLKDIFVRGTYGYLKPSSGPEGIIYEVIWLNDIINHPIYSEFIKTYNKMTSDRARYKDRIMREYIDRIYEFFDVWVSVFSPDVSGEPKANTYSAIKEAFRKTDDENYINIIDSVSNYVKSRITDADNPVYINSSVSKKNINQYYWFNNDRIAELNVHMNTVADLYSTYYVSNSRSSYSNRYRYSRIVLTETLAAEFLKLYTSAIHVLATENVRQFVEGKTPLDMNTKNSDESPLPKKNIDIVNYTSTKYKTYEILSKKIKASTSSVSPPERESSNLLLTNELKRDSKTSDKTDADYCTLPTDFFKNVYLKYIRRQYVIEPDPKKMFVGVDSVSSNVMVEPGKNEKADMFEIYVMVDTIDRKKFELGDKPRCRLHSDKLANMMNYLRNMRTTNLVNPYRENIDFDSIAIPESAAKTPSQPMPPPAPEMAAGYGRNGYVKRRYSKKPRGLIRASKTRRLKQRR